MLSLLSLLANTNDVARHLSVFYLFIIFILLRKNVLNVFEMTSPFDSHDFEPRSRFLRSLANRILRQKNAGENNKKKSEALFYPLYWFPVLFFSVAKLFMEETRLKNKNKIWLHQGGTIEIILMNNSNAIYKRENIWQNWVTNYSELNRTLIFNRIKIRQFEYTLSFSRIS